MQFDWNDANRRHIARHDVTPEEAEEVFVSDYFDLEFMYVGQEERFSVIGETRRGRILIVWSTWRGNSLRVVSAWNAPKSDKLRYLHAVGRGHEI